MFSTSIIITNETLIILVILIIIIFPILIESSNICICECCSSSRCLRHWNSTFPITECSSCTKDLCSTQYTECSSSSEVLAKCINRDSLWNKATIIIFLITLGTLILLGVARNHSTKLQKYIKNGAN
jgi:hypothetical protein